MRSDARCPRTCRAGTMLAVGVLLAVPSALATDSKAQTSGIVSQLPGAEAFDAALASDLETAWRNRASGYEPRTRHLNTDGEPKYTNRLYLEPSPYLQQHAHNPTNWYPWGDEAFDTARRLNRPVLLSVGYSTCHWCHVMEEESFEDEEIARYINEHYVAIKVDREERPDVDAVYMTVVQMLTGQGGWPMTVWLTPTREAYSGATYVPARDGDRGARIGFLTMLQRLRAAYDQEPDQVTAAAAEITRQLTARLAPAPGETAGADATTIDEVSAFYDAQFDEQFGGLRGTQKFPSGMSLRLLLRQHRRTGDARALDMATQTLERMAAGGMYDQVGGGIHRYATDARWLVPHFEKMLYDNALLVTAYLEAYQVTQRDEFAAIARDILRYLERDMSAAEGGFYAATDADSLGSGGEREEGQYFTWTPDELAAVLDGPTLALVTLYYGVTTEGNFDGRTILHQTRPLADVAAELDIEAGEARRLLDAARDTLYRARADRPAPLRDDKILTSWNALAISAFAQASLALGDAGYAERATHAADFVLSRLKDGDRLFRSYAGGEARVPGYLEDYAFLIAALLDLYEATSEPRWMEEALALDGVLAARFEDPAGGFFRTSDEHQSILTREKPGYDAAQPSGNSVQLLNLVRLHEFTTDDTYRQRTERALRAFDVGLSQAPVAMAEMLLAVDFRLDTPKEIIIITPDSRATAEPFLAELRATFLPNRILSVVGEADRFDAHAALVPLVEGKFARDGVATAYVCENRLCELPTTDPAVFAQQIRSRR
ncbi:MAG: thioredoxin domain-containing protein [Vicinamibacterales bacterium]|nr:thioredoxin domain-containing protein [Acidobacteriota bacterium]MDP7295343.1 thioredoxin domain-containing protein [Vicinamibacterales bacterium]HJO38313.1 thioredoxin domain-containing protein [Vicinamibacterales bacterium]